MKNIKKDSLARFVQDFDGFDSSEIDDSLIESIPAETKTFLQNGSIVEIAELNDECITITERICIVDGRYYDYKGEYTNSDGTTEYVFFKIENIVRIVSGDYVK